MSNMEFVLRFHASAHPRPVDHDRRHVQPGPPDQQHRHRRAGGRSLPDLYDEAQENALPPPGSPLTRNPTRPSTSDAAK